MTTGTTPEEALTGHMRAWAASVVLPMALVLVVAPHLVVASSIAMQPSLSKDNSTAPGVYYGNRAKHYVDHATRLHEALLQGYNKAVAPYSNRSSIFSKAGTDVYSSLRFFKVVEVAPSTGKMSIRVWWRMSWSDLRLSWDPADYGNITEIRFHASSITDPETTDIWLPDFMPYNAAGVVNDMFDPALALVSSAGNVFWSRPGTLDLLCRYSGLVMFPYDRLSCPLQIGGWMASGTTQGLLPGRLGGSSNCVSITTSEDEEVSQSSYSEYIIDRVECDQQTLVYQDSFGTDEWPVLRYRIHFSRQSVYYSFFALLPSVALTILSFSVFFMSFQVGERLGVGVTLVLMIEVAKVSMSTMIPVCGELLWLEIFFLVNFIFTFASLLESVVVLSFAFHDSDVVLPTSLDPRTWRLLFDMKELYKLTFLHPRPKKTRNKVFEYSAALRQVKALQKSLTSYLPNMASTPAGAAEFTPRVRVRAPDDDDGQPMSYVPIATPRAAGGGFTSVEPMSGLSGLDTPRWTDEPPAAPSAGAATPPASPPPSTSPPPLSPGSSHRGIFDDGSDVTRLIFFENLFFRLDVNGSASITFEEMRRMLAFTALDMTSAQVDAALVSADSDDADGKLNRQEFIDMCVRYLKHYPLAQLEAAATNFADFRLARQRRTNAAWQRVAKDIDEYSRFWFPATYVVAMVFVFNFNLEDGYVGEGPDGTYMPTLPLLEAMHLGENAHIPLAVVPALFVMFALLPALCLTCVLIPARERQKARAATVSQTMRDRSKLRPSSGFNASVLPSAAPPAAAATREREEKVVEQPKEPLPVLPNDTPLTPQELARLRGGK